MSGYRTVSGVTAPCGHVHGVAEGPRRGPASTTPPEPLTYVSTCFCGASYEVIVEPVLMVVGYAARLGRTIVAPKGGAAESVAHPQ